MPSVPGVVVIFRRDRAMFSSDLVSSRKSEVFERNASFAEEIVLECASEFGVSSEIISLGFVIFLLFRISMDGHDGGLGLRVSFFILLKIFPSRSLLLKDFQLSLFLIRNDFW